MGRDQHRIFVIGAGIGGLAAAIRLAAAGADVTIFETHTWPGGKMRVLPSIAGNVDAGPTVLTLRDVLEDLFESAGTTLSAQVKLTPLPVLARHFWRDGTRLDLFPGPEANAHAIGAAFGSRARSDFLRFEAETRALFTAFEAPVMRAPRPRVLAAAQAALARPRLLPWLAPGRSLKAMLARRFAEPRLQQLFGRYATYVGGNPLHAPAVLGLIWQAEARGVWAVRGGMAALASALAEVFTDLGGTLRLGEGVARVRHSGGRVAGVDLCDGTQLDCGAVVFNGDPAALQGLIDTPRAAPSRRQTHPRSLSARVWTLAAQVAPKGLGAEALAYHTVFFADAPRDEFMPLARGQTPHAPTIYVCAQDRAEHAGRSGEHGGGPERMQFILNAPATNAAPTTGPKTEDHECQIHPFTRLAQFGLHLSPTADASALTPPESFARMFPHSQGALYGLSPDGAAATFLRPGARTRLAGLYLAGGGVHPGAGVPMAALSGKHAAEAVLADRTSASMWRPTVMPGGTWTGSATTGRARFR